VREIREVQENRRGFSPWRPRCATRCGRRSRYRAEWANAARNWALPGICRLSQPIAIIRTLLEIGADSNPADDAGFPPLIAALSCSLPRLGASGRPDVTDNHQFAALIRGGSPSGGINDYTPLHLAVSERNLSSVALLLDGGADPRLRTRIDDCETAREMAEKAGFREIA
jgi:hypothetical protein